MFNTLLKYFFITFFSFIISAKISNQKMNFFLIPAKYFAISTFISVLTTLARLLLPDFNLSILFIPILFTISSRIINKSKVSYSTITSIISIGISNSIFIISLVIASIIFYLLRIEKAVPLFYLLLLTVLIESIILLRIFHIKRFSKGMPFLNNMRLPNVGVIICILILVNVSILINNDSSNHFYIIPIVLITISFIPLIIWWKSCIKRRYVERKRNEEMQKLRDLLVQKDQQINMLSLQNNELSSIIHKDNKLLPAMELSVRTYIQLCIQNKCDNPREYGESILDDLRKLTNERYGIISDLKLTHSQLPTTNVSSLDSLLLYFANKSSIMKAEMDLSISCSIKYFAHNIISENDLNTLIADLVDNALNAVSSKQQKRIFINIGVIDNSYTISIFDNGDYFEEKILLNLGVRRVTTHSSTGGSGIGLMTVSAIAKKYYASILIEEFSPTNHLYSKKVSIKFDSNSDYIVKTHRNENYEYYHRSNLIPLSLNSRIQE